MVWTILLGVGFFALIILWDRYRGPEAYREAYRKAQQADIDWVKAHPGCTLDEAHQHREAVKRKFHRSS